MFNNPLSFIDPTGLTANNAIHIDDPEEIRQFLNWLANNWSENGGGGPNYQGILNYLNDNSLGAHGTGIFGHDSNGNPGLWIQYLTPISGQAYNSDHDFLGSFNNPYMVPRWAVANKFIGFNNLGALGNAANGGSSNLVDGASFLATFTSMGYSARAYDTYNSSGWKNKSGRSFSSDLLKRGSNGKYVRGVQGYRNSANLAKNMSNSLKATGKAFGVLGVGITMVDAFSDGNLTWGDGAKIGIGLLTTFTPIGWGYGIVDFGTYVMTGTSLTDRAGNYIDGL